MRQGQITARSINQTITRLAPILEYALEYEYIARNPARGRRRRLKAPTAPRPWLDRADHITALLDAAGQLDREARDDRKALARRATLATLAFSGLRISQLCALRWRDVDLASGRITVRAAKTDSGMRRGDLPLPERLSLHGLRHTFASLLVALGEDPRYVMGQLGHTDPAFTLRLYTHTMRREDDERTWLRALVDGLEWAPAGTSLKIERQRATQTQRRRKQKTVSVQLGWGT